jgi:hypothetical protein
MKTIIDGKLYDTETAELVAVGDFVEVYRTAKGNWFERNKDIHGVNYKVEPIEANYAKRFIGIHAPDRYCKYFGEAEEA